MNTSTDNRYTLIDCAERAKNHDTFERPNWAEIQKLSASDVVKLIFADSEDEDDTCERMWVAITSVTEAGFIGTLDNTPAFMTKLAYGDTVEFKPKHIASIYQD